MSDRERWTWQDGWVLASIVIASQSPYADLAGVIGYADYINRLILSREEIEDGVNRLREARLVAPEHPLTPLDLASALWQRAEGEGGLVASVRRMVALMNREAVHSETLARWSLSPSEYYTACDLYRQRFAQASKRSGGPNSA